MPSPEQLTILAYIIIATVIAYRLYLTIRFKSKILDVVILVVLGYLEAESKPLRVILFTFLIAISIPLLDYYHKQSSDRKLVMKKWFYASIGYFITILIGLAIATWIWFTR